METKLEFNIETDDLKAYYSYFLLSSPKAKRKFGRNKIWYIVLTIIALLFGLVFWLDKKMAIPALLFSLFSFFNIFFGEKIERNMLIKKVDWLINKEKNEIIGNHKFTITEENVVDKNENQESTTRWGLIEELADDENHLFLMVRASTDFYIIPRNAFNDDTTYIQFIDTLKKYHQAALIKRNAF